MYCCIAGRVGISTTTHDIGFLHKTIPTQVESTAAGGLTDTRYRSPYALPVGATCRSSYLYVDHVRVGTQSPSHRRAFDGYWNVLACADHLLMLLRVVAAPALRRRCDSIHARNFHPVALAGALLLKKWTVYKAGSEYGWPRVYRRLLEKNREIVPAEHQADVKEAIAGVLRSPTQLFSIVRESPDAGRFLHAVATGVRSGARALPEPVQILLSTVVKSTEVGKTFSELDKYAPRASAEQNTSTNQSRNPSHENEK